MIFRNWVLENFPFLEDDFDALTDYELFCKMVAYMRKSLEKLSSFQTELNSFEVKLNEYQNYFDNLDVQEEIDNKLDEMAESGELEQIVAQYLELNTIKTFNTLSDLEDGDNIANGSYVETMGYNNVGDNGGAKYLIRPITNEDVVDGYSIVALTNYPTLIAEMIIPEVLNAHQFGIFGDGETDVTERLTKAFNYNLYLPTGTYLVSSAIPINNHLVYGDGINQTIIKLADNSAFISENILETLGVNDFTIRNLSYNGNKENNSQYKRFLSLFNSSNIVIDNIEVINSKGGGIKLNDSVNVYISNSNFEELDGIEGNTSPAIYGNPVNNLTIDNCRCKDIADHFLYLTCNDSEKYSKNIIVKNCVLTGTGKDALTAGSALCIYTNSRDVLIDNCILKENRSGIYIGNQGTYTFTPKNVIISNCLIDTTTLSAISISGIETDPVENIKINNCSIKNITQTGITLSYVDNINISNNDISDSGTGIDTEYCNFAFINDNRIYDNTNYGILVGRAGHINSNFNISNCLIYGSVANAQDIGLYLNVIDKVKVYNCDIFDNTEDIRQNIPTNYTYINQVDKKAVDKNLPSLTFSDSIPASGTYRKGDIILFNNGNTSYIGAVCTVAGTPGTWKYFGDVTV